MFLYSTFAYCNCICSFITTLSYTKMYIIVVCLNLLKLRRICFKIRLGSSHSRRRITESPLEFALEFSKNRNLVFIFSRSARYGADRDRTGDLLLAKQALSQLSYCPEIAWFHNFPIRAMGPEGIEPSTSRLSSARSNQLSYEPKNLCMNGHPEL